MTAIEMLGETEGKPRVLIIAVLRVGKVEQMVTCMPPTNCLTRTPDHVDVFARRPFRLALQGSSPVRNASSHHTNRIHVAGVRFC
jgi:hypothetical protein